MILGMNVGQCPGRIMKGKEDTKNGTGSVREKSITTENLLGNWET